MPSINLTHTPDTVAVWLATPAAQALFNPADQSSEDQARWRSQRGERRRLDWMVSRALRYGVSPPPGLPVSLSHSNGYAALAVAGPGFKVGVDLEHVRQRDAMSIARLAYSSRECADLAALDDRAGLRHFYALWTFKEACAKALNINLGQALGQCQIWRDGEGWHAAAPTDVDWSAEVLSPAAHLMLAVVRLAPGNDAATTGRVVQHEWPGEDSPCWEKVLRVQGSSRSCAPTIGPAPARPDEVTTSAGAAPSRLSGRCATN
jgi:4'-phosphopantetheinyl transferase